MKNFNNSDIFTGYLKQLLHDFNLPKIKVYTKQHMQYAIYHGKESPEILSTVEATVDSKTQTTALTSAQVKAFTKNVRYFPYIRNGAIQEYVNNNWRNSGETDSKPVTTFRYTYGDKILNYTKNLQITSNVYDSYTHEYLGDYLRFHRDFLDIDLMPLYNCFSNRACDKLKLKWTVSNSNGSAKAIFDTNDPNFKIYMIPVKLFQKYTIAIDSELPIEMCCGLFGDYQDSREKFANLPIQTYKKVNKSVFSQPFLYDALAYTEDDEITGYIDQILSSKKAADNSTLIELAQNEGDLKLFLKIPTQNTSTIVILEGDYCNWNGSIWEMTAKNSTGELDATRCIKRTNKSVINLEYRHNKSTQFPLITPLQLLQFNTREQHPFADRLIEYLIGNVIMPTESAIYDDIRRAQKALESNYSASGYILDLPGVWSNEMRVLFYEYLSHTGLKVSYKSDDQENPVRIQNEIKRPVSSLEINHDILGYVDKTVEKYYPATVKISRTQKGTVSLSNIELEEGEK